jgi:hypothetical protein
MVQILINSKLQTTVSILKNPNTYPMALKNLQILLMRKMRKLHLIKHN